MRFWKKYLRIVAKALHPRRKVGNQARQNAGATPDRSSEPSSCAARLTESVVTACLLEADGSTREINFTPTNVNGAVRLLSEINSSYSLRDFSNHHGEDCLNLIKNSDWENLFRGENGYCHCVWDKAGEGALFTFLQAFISWEDLSELEIEVTYFPDDIEPDTFTLDAFRAMVERWRSLLGSRDYCVSYGGVDWSNFNEKDPSIIYTHLRQPTLLLRRKGSLVDCALKIDGVLGMSAVYAAFP